MEGDRKCFVWSDSPKSCWFVVLKPIWRVLNVTVVQSGGGGCRRRRFTALRGEVDAPPPVIAEESLTVTLSCCDLWSPRGPGRRFARAPNLSWISPGTKQSDFGVCSQGDRGKGELHELLFTFKRFLWSPSATRRADTGTVRTQASGESEVVALSCSGAVAYRLE